MSAVLEIPTPVHSWTPVDLLAVAATKPERATIGGIFYPGKRHLLSGEAEGGKTWLCLGLAAQELRQGSSVIWIDLEMDARDVLARLLDLGLNDQQIADLFAYVQPDEPLVGIALAEMETLVAARRPSLVIVDAFSGACALHGLDENSGVQVETLYRRLDLFRAHGAAWVVLDHPTKNPETRGRYAIGSQRKLSGVDVHIAVERVTPFQRGGHGVSRLVTHKDRPGYLSRPSAGELHLESDPDTGHVNIRIEDATERTTASGFRPTALMERASLFVETAAEPVSRRKVEAAVSGKANAVRTAIDVLVTEGYFNETHGARNARLVSTAKPYRQATDPDCDQFVPTASHRVPDEDGTSASTASHPLRGDEETQSPRPPKTSLFTGGDDDIPF